MNGYTLDTDVVSAIINLDDTVIAKLQEVVNRGFKVTLNAISYYETKRGLLSLPPSSKKSEHFDKLCHLLEILFIDNISTLEHASIIYDELKKSGKPIGDADILISAIALENEMAVVTGNTKHFNRVSGLIVENWLNG